MHYLHWNTIFVIRSKFYVSPKAETKLSLTFLWYFVYTRSSLLSIVVLTHLHRIFQLFPRSKIVPECLPVRSQLQNTTTTKTSRKRYRIFLYSSNYSSNRFSNLVSLVRNPKDLRKWPFFLLRKCSCCFSSLWSSYLSLCLLINWNSSNFTQSDSNVLLKQDSIINYLFLSCFSIKMTRITINYSE